MGSVKVKNKVEQKNFDVMWRYLNKAIELGSIAAINTKGNCYRNCTNPEKIVDINKALKYYKDASEYGYIYAYNITVLNNADNTA